MRGPKDTELEFDLQWMEEEKLPLQRVSCRLQVGKEDTR